MHEMTMKHISNFYTEMQWACLNSKPSHLRNYFEDHSILGDFNSVQTSC